MSKLSQGKALERRLLRPRIWRQHENDSARLESLAERAFAQKIRPCYAIDPNGLDKPRRPDMRRFAGRAHSHGRFPDQSRRHA